MAALRGVNSAVRKSRDVYKFVYKVVRLAVYHDIRKSRNIYKLARLPVYHESSFVVFPTITPQFVRPAF